MTGFTADAYTDRQGGDLEFVAPGNSSVNLIQLATACIQDAACVYFSTTGWLKSAAASRAVTTEGANATCLYTRDAAVVGGCSDTSVKRAILDFYRQ